MLFQTLREVNKGGDELDDVIDKEELKQALNMAMVSLNYVIRNN